MNASGSPNSLSKMAPRKALRKVPALDTKRASRRTAAPKSGAKVVAIPARKNGSARQSAKDVLQFAPNFSAYLLPPGTVCFYSEDRKFFLHGELYCALVAEIAKGAKNFRQLADTLGRSFPPDKVEEALNRLIERRYVLPASQITDAVVAGYWASLGLPPEEAERNLAGCRVRVHAVDVKGGAELTAALGQLGVRIVTRSPDLT